MEMRYEHIHYNVQGPVAVITYDRQERRNAWNVAMYRETVDAFECANADPQVQVIVLTHVGPVFCSGFDFKAPPEPVDPQTGHAPRIGTLTMAKDNSWVHLMARSKPVVAAIDGPAIGAGATQLLSVDIRIASGRASFSFPFVALGHLPEMGATALLPRLIGVGRALELCLTAGKVDAGEAFRIGLVTKVVDEKYLLDEALALANHIAAFPALQVKLAKELIYANAVESDPNTYLDREVAAFGVIRRASKSVQSPSSGRRTE
jgi:2-(1,2-epoxy-1,2-dihydrophenyl)acetyl-CoA isomerase